MALGSFPALLASSAELTAVSVPKAVGIIGDDIAANAKQLMDLPPKRTWPALFKVVRGSLWNKAGTITAALALSWAAPAAILPLLAVGGFYLTAEAMGQARGKSHHGHDDKDDKPKTEQEKIAGALKVDVVLSGEITALTLGIVAAAPFLTQLTVMAVTGVALTGILYGTIGTILSMGPVGNWLKNRKGDSIVAKAARKTGDKLVKATPGVMKTIAVIGTAALFMVGGELLLGAIPGAAAVMTGIASHVPLLPGIAEHVLYALAGVAASVVSYPVMERLEEPLEKLGQKISKGYASLKDKVIKLVKKPAPANDNKSAPPAPPAAPALSTVPAVKEQLNKAATPEQTPAPPPAAPAPPKTAPKAP